MAAAGDELADGTATGSVTRDEDRDRDHDAFFDDLYRLSSEPFLTPEHTRAEVTAYLALAKPEPGARVLDLGCGWGRHLSGLSSAGLHPVGLERSAAYCRIARATGHPVIRGDVRSLPFADGAFASIACFYASLFFFDEADNLRALSEAARVVRSGGEVVLQAMNPLHLDRLGGTMELHPLPDGGSVFEETHYDRKAGRHVGFRRVTLPDGRTLEGRYSIRQYAPGELDVMARRAGLVLERTLGGLDLGMWKRDSRELVAVLRKR